jgi:hypothetical protein
MFAHADNLGRDPIGDGKLCYVLVNQGTGTDYGVAADFDSVDQFCAQANGGIRSDLAFSSGDDTWPETDTIGKFTVVVDTCISVDDAMSTNT